MSIESPRNEDHKRGLDGFVLSKELMGAEQPEAGVELASESKEAFDQMLLYYGEAKSERQHRYDYGKQGVDLALSYLSDNYARLKPLLPEKTNRPEMTICMPVELYAEEDETIIRALQAIQQSAQKHYKVIMWFNYMDGPNDDRVAPYMKFAHIKEVLQSLDLPNLQIDIALDNTAYGYMTTVRENYMDAVITDCYKNDYGANHPVLWLDADTTFIAPGALEEVASSARKLDALFVHANTQYSVDWAKGVPVQDLDTATKAVIASEVQRRQLVRDLDEMTSYEDEYPEEDGLAFAVGTYMLSGGLEPPYDGEPTRGYNEALNFIGAVQHHLNRLNVGDIQYLAPKAEENGGSIPLLKKIKSARVGMSARRHYTSVNLTGAKSLLDSEKSGYSAPATHIRMDAPNDVVTREEVVDLMKDKQEKAKLEATPLQTRRQTTLRRLVDKLFPSSSDV